VAGSSLPAVSRQRGKNILKICFLGSGALGSAIGGTLTEAGCDVYLIDQWPAHVEAINANGLKLRGPAGDRVVWAKARTSPDGIGVADLIIVLVKSFHTREAVEAAGSIIGPETVVMSLQNGMGHEEIIADVVGKAKVMAGKTYAGGVMLSPGHVIAGTKDKLTYIGELDGKITDRANRIADEFTRAGLKTIVSSNIMGAMWDKLLINVATGALSGITRLPYGGLYKVSAIKECALAAVDEGIAVTRASGVTLSIKSAEEAWFLASDGLPDEFKTSMLQSLEKGSPTEIDFINGSVVSWGERCNVATPVNKALVAAIKGIEYAMTYLKTQPQAGRAS
jgi:2-dehydropantoate 2-reductase